MARFYGNLIEIGNEVFSKVEYFFIDIYNTLTKGGFYKTER